MTAAAWVTLGLVCGFVWGGFLTLLVVAFRKERAKRAEAAPKGLWVP